MPHHLRYQSQTWATHHIVSRCLQGFSFLKPTKETNAVIRGIFCFSIHSFEHAIEVHHYAFLSNHFHILISAEKTAHMSAFIGHFKSNLARELGRLHDWHGRCGTNDFQRYSMKTTGTSSIHLGIIEEGFSHQARWKVSRLSLARRR